MIVSYVVILLRFGNHEDVQQGVNTGAETIMAYVMNMSKPGC